jgi:anaerobic selenocysteine-containing dehydrogenase
VQPLNNARSVGDMLITVGKNLPNAAARFPWPDEVTFLRETVGSLPPGAAGGSGADVLWARFLQHGGWWPGQAPGQAPPQAPTATPAANVPAPVSVAQPPAQGDAGQYPYYLQVFVPVIMGTGAGANLPWLQGSPEPLTSITWQTWVEINPATAKKLGVEKGDVVRVSTPNGDLEAPVYVFPAVREDTIAIPLGQGHTDLGRYAKGRGANAINLLGGQAGPDGVAPAWSATRCQVTPTGTSMRVATFEWTPGVEQGFINKGFPGE